MHDTVLPLVPSFRTFSAKRGRTWDDCFDRTMIVRPSIYYLEKIIKSWRSRKWWASVLKKKKKALSESVVGPACKKKKKKIENAVKTWCFSYGFDYLVFRKFAFFQTWRTINPFKTEVDNIFHAFKRAAHHSVRRFFRWNNISPPSSDPLD